MGRIAIAGAGIAGLTTALGLARAGPEVALYDAAAVLAEIGAGLQLSPNATRVLRDFELLDAVAAQAVRPERVRIRRAADGDDLAALPLGAAAERQYGAPFLVIHRGDLQAALLEAARAQPAITLTTGASIVRVESSEDGVTATTASGETILAEGLIGADGLHSQVRRFVAMADDPLRSTGRTAWRALIPAEAAPAHARLAASNLWLGHRAHLVHYPVRGGTLVNVVAIVQDTWTGAPQADDWAVAGDPAKLRRPFAGWHRDARALVEAAPEWRIWPLLDRRPLARWTRGAVTLAGDAAHPMVPFLAQGAAQAIEDAGALAAAVSRTPGFAAAAMLYERARQATATRVQRESRRQAEIYHLPSPAALARDLAFRLLGPARMLSRYDWLYAR